MENEETKPLLTKAMSTYELYTPKNEEQYIHIPTREELNEKILNYYKYYEIGYETVGRFLEGFEVALKEVMPRYNQEWVSVDIINGLENIFDNVDVQHTFEETIKGLTKGKLTGSSNDSSETSASGSASSEGTTNSTTNTSVNSNHKNVESTTPQGNILGINAKGIDTVTHADKINWDENISDDTATNEGHDTTSSSSTNTVTGSANTSRTENSETDEDKTTSHVLTRKGNQGVNTYAHDMLEFRELFENIEQQIIHDPRIKEQFMLVY